MAKRQLYKVRVRENGVKKSKFYQATSPKDAADKYRRHKPGFIMWVEKASKEQLLGIGDFFQLGDSLLKEFRRGDSLLAQTEEKAKKRGYFSKQRRRAVK